MAGIEIASVDIEPVLMRAELFRHPAQNAIANRIVTPREGIKSISHRIRYGMPGAVHYRHDSP